MDDGSVVRYYIGDVVEWRTILIPPGGVDATYARPGDTERMLRAKRFPRPKTPHGYKPGSLQGVSFRPGNLPHRHVSINVGTVWGNDTATHRYEIVSYKSISRDVVQVVFDAGVRCAVVPYLDGAWDLDAAWFYDALPKKESGAYRAWRLWELPPDTLDLKALVRDHIWQPGENVVNDPLFKMKGQSLGFYGFLDFSEMQKQEPEKLGTALSGMTYGRYAGLDYVYHLHPYGLRQWAIGSTLNYGRVNLAEKGLRAEKAIPECLVLSENEDHNLRLLSLAEKYGMKLVTLEEAQGMETGLVAHKVAKDDNV